MIACFLHGSDMPTDPTGAHCQECIQLATELADGFAARLDALDAQMAALRAELARLGREHSTVVRAATRFLSPRKAGEA